MANKIKMVELFSGIGTQKMGIERLTDNFEIVGTSEVDKYAISSYAACHCSENIEFEENIDKEYMVNVLQKANVGYDFKEQKHTITTRTAYNKVLAFYKAHVLSKNYGDISLVKGSDIPNNIDILTFSFPCIDISAAGKGKGIFDGEKSGLVFEVLRILQEKELQTRPKVLLMENVSALLNKNHIDGFEMIKSQLELLGYTNHFEVLSATDFNIPQSRERIFMVSVLDGKDFTFPKGIGLNKSMIDILEENVDQKYYLDKERAEKLILRATEKNPKN